MLNITRRRALTVGVVSAATAVARASSALAKPQKVPLVQETGKADLTGSWDDITPKVEGSGKRVACPKVSLLFHGSACTWQEEGGRIIRQSLFVLDKADPQRAIDFVTVEGDAFWTTRALFKVEGDTLTIREGALGQVRPTSLVPAKSEDGWPPVKTFKLRSK